MTEFHNCGRGKAWHFEEEKIDLAEKQVYKIFYFSTEKYKLW